MDRDEQYIKLAIDMAKTTVGQTSPNPSVGAVVVKDNEVVGLGVHVKAGEAHAEINALKMAGDKAKNATIYVTLEPCSHYGKTPPCAQAIIDAGMKRVVIASDDPNPKVAGRGIKMLENAGIEVATGVLREQADSLNANFFHFIETGEPYVYLKTAMTLDGKIATSSGESQWITGENARNDGHQYRRRCDAILVGVQTVINDDPKLTTRMEGNGKNPVRIILDNHLRTPLSSQLIQNDEAPTWIITSSRVSPHQLKAYRSKDHVEVISLKSPAIKIPEVLRYLGEKNITSLLVEGGGTIADAFVRAGKVSELVAYIAPKLLGGKDALTPVEGKGFEQLKQALHLRIHSTEMVGEDIKVTAIPKGRT
ncbi:diaminohydroxyphosphoribosylaminopyrimidine deaminase / 5-amino-6-(5-phosphoribosylamino)uracil reductase [Thalassobacillus cyri]|uniref:Riboflavin biosynthesis protein RibD n=1 Tax=Thalassobacillus cyri TaxID=571932 RepID=A0A1H4DIT0_9BACI|nr:bifunctional diaminohydroxyphosphoribosylaminopyrimidine deaminase/5-amino-6-(5-phosphoribosylamino)uracil reductase RibD [Thalassobacillus cyri]SEA72379.1 diaminohydroxyphosphoribosylaminopyrimidine deaminase / 5-amino-6-(5-phosphoribosylamino)uracil reductase [Thalassobacillus cyri]